MVRSNRFLSAGSGGSESSKQRERGWDGSHGVVRGGTRFCARARGMFGSVGCVGRGLLFPLHPRDDRSHRGRLLQSPNLVVLRETGTTREIDIPTTYEQALRDEFDQLYEEGAHRRRMMWALPEGGYEFGVFWAAMIAVFAVLGGGRYSADRELWRSEPARRLLPGVVRQVLAT